MRVYSTFDDTLFLSQAGLTPEQRAYVDLDDISDERHRTESE